MCYSKRRHIDQLIIGLAILLYDIPIVFDLLITGWQRVFSNFAVDGFYYFTIGRNYARQDMFSFAQQLPTNGFYPLWQVLLGGYYLIADFLSFSQSAIMVGILLSNLIVISIALLLLGRMFLETTGHVPSLFLFLPVGFYALLISPPVHDQIV